MTIGILLVVINTQILCYSTNNDANNNNRPCGRRTLRCGRDRLGEHTNVHPDSTHPLSTHPHSILPHSILPYFTPPQNTLGWGGWKDLPRPMYTWWCFLHQYLFVASYMQTKHLLSVSDCRVNPDIPDRSGEYGRSSPSPKRDPVTKQIKLYT